MGMQPASALLVTVLLTGCHGTTPYSWTLACMSSEAEALAGARAAPVVEARYGGIIRAPQAERRMHRIGRRLTRGTPEVRGAYQYRLLNADKLNAMSLPGGRIYMTRALYDRLESDEQVAAILAHEIAHLALKDHFKPRCGSREQALDREMAADGRGSMYLRRADIGTQAMIDVIHLVKNAQPKGWSDSRIRSLLSAAGRSDTSDRSARR